ncbi:MAG: aldo/keto reductase [Parachlamydiales bacterium]|nr:aldo/keto reductase [Verrucomicrobiota bacterium]MBX3720128.1 aldo/keto reductase [Candidatus Acheromyda pituitae]
MEYISLPPLNKQASRIGLGTWAIGGWMWGGSDEKASIATVARALQEGITFIDTAAAYGFGLSEEIVGKALKQVGNRENVIIATKCGLSWSSKENVYRDSSSAKIIQECEDSLRRLQLDYIDIYQVHWPDPKTPIPETAEALSQLLKQGKIRAIGVSNFSVEQMEVFRKTAPLHTCQPPFNLFERDAEQNQLAYCLKNQIAVIGYGSLCRGLLTGKITKDTVFKGDDLRKSDPKFQDPQFSRYLRTVQQLDNWSRGTHQRSVLALAIRWALDKGISVALWGARRPEQLDPIRSMWDWKLSADDMRQIDQITQDVQKLQHY